MNYEERKEIANFVSAFNTEQDLRYLSEAVQYLNEFVTPIRCVSGKTEAGQYFSQVLHPLLMYDTTSHRKLLIQV